ncbi:MAG TPA: hypothetical protein VFB80_15295 [Pirellulaceae bacterium]|nr:hypothetical protein [Pirellulaceae bacterium]
MRYKLRTLLILLAILPPLLWIGWTKYSEWKAEQERQRAQRELVQQLDGLQIYYGNPPPRITPPATPPAPTPTDAAAAPDSPPEKAPAVPQRE